MQLKLSDIIIVSGLNNWQYFAFSDLKPFLKLHWSETCANYTPLSQRVTGDMLNIFNAKIMKMNLFIFSSDRMNR